MMVEQNLTLKENKDYIITDLTAKQQRFVHLYVTGHYTIAEIAELLLTTPKTIHQWLKRPDVRGVVEDLQLNNHELVKNNIKTLSIKAVNKLSDLIDSEVDQVAMSAVKDVLDRSGHKVKNEIEVNKTIVTYEQKLNSIINESIDQADLIEGVYEVLEDEEE